MKKEKEYDVLIVGGGIAGISAALESSRSGLSTALVEKTILWGGLATSGLVPIYMPLCNGNGKQVTFGIAEELLKLSIKYGPGNIPSGWFGQNGEELDFRYDELYPEGKLNKRYLTIYSPMAFVFELDEILGESSVDLWLDTLACQPVMKGNKITGIEVENKSGRILIKAKCIIDGTGDADIAYRCNAPCEEKGSYPSFLYQYASLMLAKEAVQKNSAFRLITWQDGGGANEYNEGYKGNKGIFTGTSGKGVSEFVMESRSIAREKLKAEQEGEGESGRENIYPASLPTMVQIRMSRRIIGMETVLPDMCNKYNENSVGLIADCREINSVWEVPYGALIPQNVENLLVIGRCVSAEGYAWQVTRLIPAAALTGQISGIAVKLAIQHNTSPDKIHIKDIQKCIKDKGIILHI